MLEKEQSHRAEIKNTGLRSWRTIRVASMSRVSRRVENGKRDTIAETPRCGVVLKNSILEDHEGRESLVRGPDTVNRGGVVERVKW